MNEGKNDNVRKRDAKECLNAKNLSDNKSVCAVKISVLTSTHLNRHKHNIIQFYAIQCNSFISLKYAHIQSPQL